MTNKKFITEGLDFHSMEGQLIPKITVDEYAAKMGSNKDIVTLSFTVNSKAAGTDLVEWFERGYNYILDAQVSEGELENNKWLVFVEMSRRSVVPSHIIELLDDLTTLTNLKVKDWAVQVDDEEYDPEESVLKQVIICNPNEYKMKKEEQDALNEMLEIAGIDSSSISKDDAYIKQIKSLAGY